MAEIVIQSQIAEMLRMGKALDTDVPYMVRGKTDEETAVLPVQFGRRHRLPHGRSRLPPRDQPCSRANFTEAVYSMINAAKLPEPTPLMHVDIPKPGEGILVFPTGTQWHSS